MITDHFFARMALIAAVAMAAPGCLEHTVRTTVSSDGSCERVVSVTAQKGEVPATPFPLPSDRSWAVTWERKAGDSSWLYVARKRFPSYDALRDEYDRMQQPTSAQATRDSLPGKIAHGGDGGTLRLSVQVEKKARWFYTYYSYREVYPVTTPYTLVKPEDVLSEDEIRRISRGEDSDTLKHRYDAWVTRNLIEGFYLQLERELSSPQDSAFTPAMLRAKKPDLFRAMTGDSGSGPARDIDDVLAGYLEKSATKHDLFAKDMLTPAGARAVIALMQDVYGPAAARVPPRAVARAFDAASLLMTSAVNDDGSFTNTVTLPGMPLSGNAAELSGPSATWRFTMRQLSMRDYVMTAESRTVNVAAFVASGAVLLLALAFLALRLSGRVHGLPRQVARADGHADLR
jgi:hypothetical protein